MPTLVLIFIGVVAALVLLGTILGVYASRKRRQELLAWAQSKGLEFNPSRTRYLEGQFPEFDCLRNGENRYAYNLINGKWHDRSLLGFDYHYETHSTDSKGHRQTHHYHFSAVIVSNPVPLKPLFIRPEGFFDKVTAFFGHDDIDFESAEFSRKFYVKAPEKKWAYDVIHARTMEFLLGMPRFSLKFAGNHAIAYRGSKFKVREFAPAIEVVTGVLDRLPEYLLQEQRGGA